MRSPRDGGRSCASLLDTMPRERRAAVVDGLRAFAEAAGEVPDAEWAMAPVGL